MVIFGSVICELLSIPLYFTESVLGRVKTRKLVFASLIGLVLIVATVVRYFDAAYYPIRAVFFINFGFVIYIGAFVAIIIHLFTNLVAK